jgi:hypothetical protein
MKTRHYEVWADRETLVDRWGFEPRGFFEYVIADNPAQAKANALASPGFCERETDGNPFVGMRVRLSRCKHGLCYCDMCVAECGECPDCAAAVEADHE